MSEGWQRREVGHTQDAGWQIGVSKTIDRPVGEVWAYITSPEGVTIWLGEDVTVLPERGAGYETKAGVQGETRSFHDLDRIRLTWQPPDWAHETTLQLTVRSAGKGRTRLTIHQERLANATEREQQRRHWRGVITTLATALTEPPPSTQDD